MKKYIKNYENYVIYDNGDVINEQAGRYLKGKVKLNGYKVYTLSKNNIKQDFYAHRLVADYFIPNPNNLPVVNHKDGNKLNNDVSNLEWVSYSQNTEHAYQNNLIKKEHKTIYYEKDLDDEIWKEVLDFPNYQISNLGRIRNINSNRILQPSLTCGYYKVRLSNKGIVKDYLIHHLVFEYFHDEKYNSNLVIDHIDGNKLNNNFNNLRLLSREENAMMAYYKTNTNPAIKPVLQFDKDMNFIQEFQSVREAARQLNLDSSTISKVCRGVNKTHGGYIFRYKT